MKQLLRILCAIILLATSPLAYGETFTVGNLTYTTSGSTVSAKAANKDITSADIPETIEYNGSTYTVTSIGEKAFENCSSLTEITIPSSVYSVENLVFLGCTGLKEVTIEDGAAALSLGYNEYYIYGYGYITSGLFGDCPLEKVYIGRNLSYDSGSSYGYSPFANRIKITSVTIGSNVTEIGNYLFYGCSSLHEITIPTSVTSIGNNAFYGCSGLKEVTIEDGETTMSLGYNSSYSGQFGDCPLEKVYIGRNLNYSSDSFTGYSPFAKRTKLISVTIGSNVTKLNDFLFYSCSSLAEITLPNSVTSIGHSALYGCSALSQITIPNSVTSIGSYTFQNCSSLKEISIPNSVTSIGSYTFQNCSSLKEISIPNSVTSIGSFTFQNCSSLKEISIPNSVTSIGNSVFSSCSSLEEISIPDSVTSIGSYTFQNCYSLKEISIPNSVTSIGEYAFSSCTSLKEMSIPNSVTSIGNYVFEDCSGLKEVTIEDGETTLSLGYNSYSTSSSSSGSGQFASCPLEKVYIGRNLSYESGKSYGYSSFANRTKLTSVTIGSNVTSIGWYLFYGCSSITEITIPNSVTSIGNNAYLDCSSLAEITIPNSVTSIGEYAFYGCEKLKSIYYDPGVEQTIFGKGSVDFELTSLYISTPEKTLSILNNAQWNQFSKIFYKENDKIYVPVRWDPNLMASNAFFSKETGCLSELNSTLNLKANEDVLMAVYAGVDILSELESEHGFSFIPSEYWNLNYIYGASADSNDSRVVNIATAGNLFNELGLQNIEKITYLKISGFLNGNDIITINRMTSLKYLDICEATIMEGGLSYRENLKTQNNVIGSYFFSDCKNLTNVILSNTAVGVDANAFNGMSNIENILIGKSTENINPNAFKGCSSLVSISIPRSVTSIGYGAFSGCIGLNEVTIEDMESTLSLDCNPYSSGLFGYCPLKKIYIGRNLSYDSGYSYAYSPFSNQLELSSIAIGPDVTEIGEYLFYGCSSLTEITIPNSVTSIGNYAFNGCSGLKELTIEDGDTTLSLGYNSYSTSSSSSGSGQFAPCPLEKIYIGRNLSYYSDKSYGYSPFAKRTILTSITIGSSVTKISDYLFYGCSSLAEITIPNSVTSIGNYALAGCSLHEITIPNSVTSIGDYTFNDCLGLKEVTIEDGETILSLGSNSSSSGQFASCPLEKVYMGRNLSFKIGNGTLSRFAPFANQKKLTTVTIGSNVTEIGEYMFDGCSSLLRVNISDLSAWCRISFANASANPLYYAEHLYLNDELLTDIVIPDGITSINNYVFHNGIDISSVTIPNSVTSIGYFAFDWCIALTEINIPNSITYIGMYAFNHCTSLIEINIPNSVTSIGEYTFSNCSSLAKITIPNSVTSIGSSAFLGCSNLTKIRSLNPTPPEITTSVFSGVDKETCQLIVTKGNLVHYWLDPVWREFLNISDDMVYLSPLPVVTYGAEPVDLSLYAPEGVTFTYETSNPDVALIDGTMLSIVGAGTATVGALYDQSGTPMEIIGQMRQFVVDKAELTIEVENMSIEQGDPIPPFILKTEGLVYDDSLEDVGELPEIICEATETSAPGEYPIYLVGGESRNYKFNLVAGVLTILGKDTSAIDEIEIDEETGSDAYTEDDGTVHVFNYNGILMYEGPEDEMVLEKGLYIIVKGKESKQVLIR